MKFRYKVLALNLIFLSVSIGIVGYLMIHRNFQLAKESQIRSAVAQNNLLQASVEYELLQLINSNNKNFAGEITEIGNRVFEGIQTTEASMYIKYGDSYVFSTDNKEGEINKSLFDNIGDGKKHYIIQEEDNKYYAYVTSFDSVEDNNLYIINKYDISDAYIMMENQINYFRILLILVILFASVVMYIISRYLTAPLEKLNIVTDEISKGNYDTRVTIKSKDEVGLLADKFNEMTAAIGNHVDELNDMIKRREQFVADFTHEIKTPMTTIIGYADTLRSREIDREEQIRALSYIFSEGKRLEKMSAKLFELIYLNQNEIEKTSVQTENLGKEIVDIVTPMLRRKNIKLIERFEPAVINGNSELLTSMFINIIDNARKASDEGKTIMLIGENIEEEGKKYYTIRVEDEGIGLDKEEIDKICDEFYMSDKSRSRKEGGAGIGMSLVKIIADRHSAKIAIESEKGIGTTISIIMEVME